MFTQSAAVTDARESSDKVDTSYAESGEKLVVVWHVNVEAILVGWGAVRWSAALFEFVAVQWICRAPKWQDNI